MDTACSATLAIYCSRDKAIGCSSSGEWVDGKFTTIDMEFVTTVHVVD